MDSTSSLADAFEYFLAQPKPRRMDSTKRKYRVFFAAFLQKYGEKPLAEIDSELVHGWFEYLESLGYSRGYLSFYRNCFHAFFNFASEYTGFNPAHRLPNYPQTAVVIETANEHDVERCLVACEAMWDTLKHQRDSAIFALGSVGLRASNVAGTRYSEMVRALARPERVGGCMMYILPTSGKRPMEAVFDERRAGIIRRWVNNRPKVGHDWLFVNLITLEPLTWQGYRWARINVCKAAGVPLISFQKMRRMVGSRVAREKGALTASHVLGHRSGIQIVLNHYYNPDLEAARVAAFESLFFGKVPE
jgi:site-specific recombinase XerD